MAQSIYIKNMVCPRCIAAVNDIFESENIHPLNVALGEVQVEAPLDEMKIKIISKKLKKNGFELLESERSRLISQIKAAIIKQIHHSTETLSVNFSTYLSENLNHDYGYLSRLFSAVEGVTIEKFITAQKIEKVKELLFYDEKNLTQIAYQLNYSSVAHLSSQFKKETGMTPTAYKKQNSDNRKMLDQI